jgi:WD40 repeat protein
MLVSADMYSIYSTAPDDSLQTIRVWDTISGEQIALLSELTQNATFGVFAYSPNGEYFSVGGTIWDTASWQIVQEIEPNRIRETTFSIDSEMFISREDYGDIIFWDVQTGDVIHSLEGTGDFCSVLMAHFSP